MAFTKITILNRSLARDRENGSNRTNLALKTLSIPNRNEALREPAEQTRPQRRVPSDEIKTRAYISWKEEATNLGFGFKNV
jgi:hypothetical protein